MLLCSHVCCVCAGIPAPVSSGNKVVSRSQGSLTLREPMPARSLGVLGRQREHIYQCVPTAAHK